MPKQSFLGEKCDQTFPHKSHKKSHSGGRGESSFLLFLGDCLVGGLSVGGRLSTLLKNESRFDCVLCSICVRCSIRILLIKPFVIAFVRCSIRHSKSFIAFTRHLQGAA